jgi:hypothetical protein
MAGKEDYQAHENTILAELIEVKDDLIICEYESALSYTDACEQCDEGAWLEDAGGGPFASAEECRESKGCSTSSPVELPVFKPLSLQKTPFEGKTIPYGDYEVTYTYVSPQKRKAKYSVDTTRCEAGEHIEIVSPPYRVRVGTPAKMSGDTILTEESKDFIEGDLIRVSKNVYEKQPTAAARSKGGNLKDPGSDDARAQFTIDMNVDGRMWLDDCGTKQKGGSVWV